MRLRGQRSRTLYYDESTSQSVNIGTGSLSSSSHRAMWNGPGDIWTHKWVVLWEKNHAFREPEYFIMSNKLVWPLQQRAIFSLLYWIANRPAFCCGERDYLYLPGLFTIQPWKRFPKQLSFSTSRWSISYWCLALNTICMLQAHKISSPVSISPMNLCSKLPLWHFHLDI